MMWLQITSACNHPKDNRLLLLHASFHSASSLDVPRSLPLRKGRIACWLQGLFYKNHRFHLLKQRLKASAKSPKILCRCITVHITLDLKLLPVWVMLTQSQPEAISAKWQTISKAITTPRGSLLITGLPSSLFCCTGVFSHIMPELIGPLLCERKSEGKRESEGSIHYATQITIRLGTLIGSERYPSEEC